LRHEHKENMHAVRASKLFVFFFRRAS